jgi:acyl-CoA reductase-like NAD-dependent aldehyde dehydrogenase
MIPDEEPTGAAGPAQPPLGKGRRRSRRGGRRHPRRRDPRPPGEPSGAAVAATEPYEPVAPAAEGEADVETERAPEPASTRSGSAVSQAIDQVSQVIEELKRALDEMEEVLETLELAERQKIDDEREIESLQRALRRLHRPASVGEPRRERQP